MHDLSAPHTRWSTFRDRMCLCVPISLSLLTVTVWKLIQLKRHDRRLIWASRTTRHQKYNWKKKAIFLFHIKAPLGLGICFTKLSSADEIWKNETLAVTVNTRRFSNFHIQYRLGMVPQVLWAMLLWLLYMIVNSEPVCLWKRTHGICFDKQPSHWQQSRGG